MKGKIFNAQEVQAIIAGNKTMFREVLKTCKHHPNNLCQKVRNTHYGIYLKEDGLFWQPYGGSELQPFPYCDGKLSASNSLGEFCPYQVGEPIFVKESFSKLLIHSGHQYYYPAHCIRECVDRDNGFHYWADGNPEFGDWESPRPATHMKQEHSRLTLQIKNIGVERLKDINREDCLKEGIEKMWLQENEDFPRYEIGEHSYFDPKKTFENFWNATHKKLEEKWEANPWVFVYEFEVLDLKK